AEVTTSQEADVALEAEIGTLTQTVQTLSSERDGMANELAQTQASIDAMDADLNAVSEQNAALQQEVETATARVVELNDALSEAAPGDSEEVIASLRAQLGENDATLTDLRASVTELTSDLSARDQATADLTGQLSGLEAQVESLSGVVAERDTLISSLQTQLADVGSSDQTTGTQIATLTADLEARQQAAEELENQLSGVEAQVESLTGVVAERDTLISSLEVQLADAGTSGQEAGAQIAALTATLTEKDASIASLQAAAAAAAAASIPTATPQNEEEPVTAEVETEEDAPQSTNSAEALVEQCVTRAGTILTQAPITFDTGTATFSEGSAATIEQLSVLAADCQHEDLVIEIGAHTDSQGPEGKNQTLSELRAQTVFDYMAEFGVSPTNMRATGFGETQPIQSNGSIAGRAANRRVTLEWLPK
ncbi:MAG: OmpA family protein, partial [Litoreibacter sp.]